MFIYKIINHINNKVYIGQTRRTVESRYREHINAAIRGCGYYLTQAMRKYGIENFSVETLCTANDVSELNELEHRYIEQYRSNDSRFGYNLAPGGESNTMDSPTVKAKHDAKMRSPEVRSKISETVKQRIAEEGRTEEYTKNLRDGFQQYLKSQKFKEDCAKRHLTPEHFKALNDAKNKAVYCIDVDGNIVAEFSRVKDAAKWWFNNGYKVKNYDQLMDRIKESSKYDKFIRGLKWVYRV